MKTKPAAWRARAHGPGRRRRRRRRRRLGRRRRRARGGGGGRRRRAAGGAGPRSRPSPRRCSGRRRAAGWRQFQANRAPARKRAAAAARPPRQHGQAHARSGRRRPPARAPVPATRQPHFFSGSVVEYDAAGGGYNIKYDLDGEQRLELLDAADDARRRPSSGCIGDDGLPTVRDSDAGDQVWPEDYDDCPSRLPARARRPDGARRKGKKQWDGGGGGGGGGGQAAAAPRSRRWRPGRYGILDLTDYAKTPTRR